MITIENLEKTIVPVLLDLPKLAELQTRRFHRESNNDKVNAIVTHLSQGGWVMPIIIGKRITNETVLLDGEARRRAALLANVPLMGLVVSVKHELEEIRLIESLHTQEALSTNERLKLNVPSLVLQEIDKLSTKSLFKEIIEKWDHAAIITLLKKDLMLEDLEDFLTFLVTALKITQNYYENKVFLKASLTFWNEIKNSQFDVEMPDTYQGLSKHSLQELDSLTKKKGKEEIIYSTLKGWYTTV